MNDDNIQTTAEAAEAHAMPRPRAVHTDPGAATDEAALPERRGAQAGRAERARPNGPISG